ncbi:YcgL domain-containing protein [Glaciecola sp. MH2013]|uniref:YcgL domain-containing protein n=1 Tax=Glaciecola sp. MH2013 TaxID=2785524 RepID=UPI00189D4B7D|nr:YcgL domain-containing protein [Glaciecola sp. MH2013]MBF7072506.1 YcgL domain-containing protein [Glaciecola sp. MH2013]
MVNLKLCAVYKSPKKADTYLYLANKDKFDAVPQALLETFGKPKFVMLVPLTKPRKIGKISSDEMIETLQSKGFYLQLPPKEENLLTSHRLEKGLNAQPDKKF